MGQGTARVESEGKMRGHMNHERSGTDGSSGPNLEPKAHPGIQKVLWTVEETAEALSIGRTSVYKLMSRGELPVVRIGKSVRLQARTVIKWAEAQEEEDFE